MATTITTTVVDFSEVKLVHQQVNGDVLELDVRFRTAQFHLILVDAQEGVALSADSRRNLANIGFTDHAIDELQQVLRQKVVIVPQ